MFHSQMVLSKICDDFTISIISFFENNLYLLPQYIDLIKKFARGEECTIYVLKDAYFKIPQTS